MLILDYAELIARHGSAICGLVALSNMQRKRMRIAIRQNINLRFQFLPALVAPVVRASGRQFDFDAHSAFPSIAWIKQLINSTMNLIRDFRETEQRQQRSRCFSDRVIADGTYYSVERCIGSISSSPR